MAEHNHKDEVTGVDTTGHEWDGIRELDNPLPRWWLWIFYACVAWSVVYMIFMPALPAPPGFEGFTRGLTGNSERVNVAQQMPAGFMVTCLEFISSTKQCWRVTGNLDCPDGCQECKLGPFVSVPLTMMRLEIVKPLVTSTRPFEPAAPVFTVVLRAMPSDWSASQTNEPSSSW